jgi:hypothetical protein
MLKCHVFCLLTVSSRYHVIALGLLPNGKRLPSSVTSDVPVPRIGLGKAREWAPLQWGKRAFVYYSLSMLFLSIMGKIPK